MAGFIAEAVCTGSCGITTQHAFTYDTVNDKVYAICRVCGVSHTEQRSRVIAYAKAQREPIKGTLNILRENY